MHTEPHYKMKELFCLLLCLQFAFAAHAQQSTRQFMVQVNENTVIKDSLNHRISYPLAQKLLASGSYTLDPIRDANGKSTGEYRIRQVKPTDAGNRELIVRSPGAEELPKPKIGEQIPDFECIDINGKKISSADLKGKIVVINFWFSVCKPCLYELPYINQMAIDFALRDDVVFLAPNWEKPEPIKKLMEMQPMIYTPIAEANAMISAFKVRAFPTHIIADRNGKITTSYAGGMPGIEELLRKDIKALLEQQ